MLLKTYVEILAKASGRKGLTADSILRAAVLKQMMGLSYEELSFYLVDSISYRSFTEAVL
jgi:hypothetical protein